MIVAPHNLDRSSRISEIEGYWLFHHIFLSLLVSGFGFLAKLSSATIFEET